MRKGPDPVSREAYDKLANSYSDRAPTKPHNAYYERPVTLSLLGDIRGRRVLDAACGPGIYAELLADSGAEVIGFDASEKIVTLARLDAEGHRGRSDDCSPLPASGSRVLYERAPSTAADRLGSGLHGFVREEGDTRCGPDLRRRGEAVAVLGDEERSLG